MGERVEAQTRSRFFYFACFYKTFSNMENIKLAFMDESNETELTAFANANNELYIEINMHYGTQISYIALNRTTAIKLVKELRKQISYLE